jgi:hypothetical protein
MKNQRIMGYNSHCSKQPKVEVLLYFFWWFCLISSKCHTPKASLELNNTTVQTVIEEPLSKKTDFRFIYKMNDIDLNPSIISIRVKDQND